MWRLLFTLPLQFLPLPYPHASEVLQLPLSLPKLASPHPTNLPTLPGKPVSHHRHATLPSPFPLRGILLLITSRLLGFHTVFSTRHIASLIISALDSPSVPLDQGPLRGGVMFNSQGQCSEYLVQEILYSGT